MRSHAHRLTEERINKIVDKVHIHEQTTSCLKICNCLYLGVTFTEVNNSLPNLKAGKLIDPNLQDFLCSISVGARWGSIRIGSTWQFGLINKKKRKNNARTQYRHECEPGTQMQNTTGSSINIWWPPFCSYSPSNFEPKLWPNAWAIWMGSIAKSALAWCIVTMFTMSIKLRRECLLLGLDNRCPELFAHMRKSKSFVLLHINMHSSLLDQALDLLLCTPTYSFVDLLHHLHLIRS